MEYVRPFSKEALDAKSEDVFYELLGVRRFLFQFLLDILTEDRDSLHQKGGRPWKLTIFDYLVIMLLYMKQYTTMQMIAEIYGINKSTVSRIYKATSSVLLASGKVILPDITDAKPGELILIDATETEINRPKKNRKNTIPVKRKSTP